MRFQLPLLEPISTVGIVRAEYLVLLAVKIQMMVHQSSLYLLMAYVTLLQNSLTLFFEVIGKAAKGQQFATVLTIHWKVFTVLNVLIHESDHDFLTAVLIRT